MASIVRRLLPDRFALLFLSIVLTLTACVPVRSAPRAPRPSPPPERIEEAGGLLGAEIRPVASSILGSVAYDLPVEANSWVEAELNFLVTERRDVVGRWMERGGYYEEFVKQVFREHGIPTDLYHLALIESGFIPTARSRAGAVGIWQFMPATSRDVRLRVDDLVDERMDPVRSTRAAARHLAALHRIHGDWALAAAAYNAGSTRISRGLERYAARNFWDLALRGDLAPETQHYVPRLYAMTIIGRDPHRFGFAASRQPQGFAFDSIHVDFSIGLDELAEMAGLAADRLLDLNPHLHRGITPMGGYWVWVPAGTGVDAQRAYIAATLRRDDDAGTYTVRWGDSLGRIAQQTGLTATRIRELNPGVDFDRLQAGETIRLPTNAIARLEARGDTPPAAPAPSPARSAAATSPASPAAARSVDEIGTYTVVWGDTFGRIVQRSGVPAARIRELNPNLNVDRLQAGARLRLPASGIARLEGNDVLATAPETPRASGGGTSSGASPRAEPRPAATDTEGYTVRWGDTLGHLAQRSGVPASRIRQLNPSVDFDRLITGTRIQLPADGVARLRGETTTVAAQESSTRTPALATVAAAPTRSPASESRVHQVRAGDTLSGIAREYGVTMESIQRANGMSGTVVRLGQRLTIPAGASAATPATVEHVVANGDTLWGIARQYGSTVEEIRTANRLGERPIVPGQRLTIPSSRR